MRALVAHLTGLTQLRYLAVSVVALAVDMGCLSLLVALRAPAMPASAAAYALGIVVHWMLSARAVFADSVAESGVARTRQKALFVVSALIGLAITTAVVGAGSALGLDPRLAKIPAVAISFVATWLLRERVVFA